MKIQGFYIITEDCNGEETCPGGWSGPVKKGTPVALTYFDEQGMEFTDGTVDGEGLRDFRLMKPCPVIAAASCQYCGKIVPTIELEKHIETDDNCKNVRKIEWKKIKKKHGYEDVKIKCPKCKGNNVGLDFEDYYNPKMKCKDCGYEWLVDN